MKIFISIVVVLCITSCSGRQSVHPREVQEDSILYPYAAIYTDHYENGKNTNSLKVLEIWKEFESGDVRHLARYFSDSITLVFPDAFLKGARDTVLGSFQKRRNLFEDVQCYIDSWIPVHVPDRNEDLVFLWGRQDGSSTGKKRIYRIVHEIWRFDTSGKIKRMEQYSTHPY